MSELDFFRPSAAASLIAFAGAARWRSDADPDRLFRRIAALDRAGPDHLTAFLEGDDPADLAATRAGGCFVEARDVEKVPRGTIALVSEHPLEAVRFALAMLRPDGCSNEPIFERWGIDPAAIVHSDAKLEQGVSVDAGAVIGPRVEIGGGSTIGAHAVIGAGVRIGRGSIVEAHASIHAALIGDRVRIHAGARIGVGSTGAPMIGRVIVQDGVEIGANAVIARGRLGDTMIGEGASVATLAVVIADTLVERQDKR